jgi:hypothetical protein
MLVLSLRHGPPPVGRRCFPVSPKSVLVDLQATSLEVVVNERAESLSRANRARAVTWTWLALRKPTR